MCSLVTNGITYYLFATRSKQGYFIYDVFTTLELACFLLFIKQIIKNKLVKYLPLLFILFSIFNIVDYFLLRNDATFNSIASGVESILIIIFCLYYFYEQLREANTLLIYTTHHFWIIIGFLIFFSGTFFLYLYSENFLKVKVFRDQYVIINSVFYLLKNILFSIAMLMKPQPPESQVDFPDENIISDWNNIRSFKNVN